MPIPEVSFEDEAGFAWRQENFARLFLNAYKYCENEIQKRVNELGYTEIRPVHLGVMRELDMAGTRVTVLADRVGVTKQAMSQLVKECERLDVVDTVPDPSDGRAKIVIFTKKGRKFIELSKSVIESIEADIYKHLGKKKAKELRQSLRQIRNEITS